MSPATAGGFFTTEPPGKSGSFFKCCSEESEVMLMNLFVSCFIKIHWPVLPDFVTSSLNHVGSICKLNLQFFHMSTHFIR